MFAAVHESCYAFHRLPATYAQRDAAEAGGLMTYGPQRAGLLRAVAVH
jgi:hypothetical protein